MLSIVDWASLVAPVYLFAYSLCLCTADRDADRDRDSIFRMRERTRWLDNALREDAGLSRIDRDRTDSLVSETKKSSGSSQNLLLFGEDLQFWIEKVLSKLLHLFTAQNKAYSVNG